MGCKTKDTDLCNDFSGTNSGHCSAHNPGEGVSFTVKQYPVPAFKSGNYSIPGRDDDAVMYGFTEECVSTGGVGGSGTEGGATASNCGKVSRSLCSGFSSTCTVYNGYYPVELSFDYNVSDTWISYLYDTSDDAGVAGTPCYHIVTTTTSSTTPGESTANADSSQTCHPCTAFYCESDETELSYTAGEDLTGDPDCPHPTLFGFGTSSNKIAFSYDDLSDELPDGVVDFDLSYNGATYVDAWDEDAQYGIAYESTQNPWQSGDEEWQDFEIYDLNLSETKFGLRVKARISPIFDDSVSPIVFSGTRWVIEEILDPGTGYSAGDVATLTYDYTHPDSSVTTLEVDLKITNVGPVSVINSQSGFDVLRIGDTINGHTITRTFHMDIDNFPYHVAYLDEEGSVFTKDTQYTSSRNHTITVVAGHGIKDRAILVGKYEFLNKSIQYSIASLNRNAVDTFSGDIVQPEVNVTITNGRVTGTSIVSGGQGWNQIGRPPILSITAPPISSGKSAELKGTFTGGVLTAIEIKSSGSGYDSTDPPSVFIGNIRLNSVERVENAAYNEETPEHFKRSASAIPKTDEVSVSSQELNSIDEVYSEMNQYSDSISRIPDIDIKKDPQRRRVRQLPQQLYTENAMEPAYEATEHKHNLTYLSDTPISRDFKTKIVEEKERDVEQRKKDIQDITQPVYPEFSNQPETYIETVQGSFTDLPESSTFTKYILKQYRPDNTKETTINITLSCSPVDSGCLHFACAPPAAPASTTSSFDEPDTETEPTEEEPNPTVPVSYTTTSTVSPLLGTGCKSWSISGSMKIYNDLTRAAEAVSQAAAAYGNPF